MINTIIDVFGFVWLIVSIGTLVKAINKKEVATNKLVDEILLLAGGMRQDLGVLSKHVTDSTEMSTASNLYNAFKVPIAKDGVVRVFGLVLYKSMTKQFQLIMSPAKNVDEARKNVTALLLKEGAVPSDWKTLVEGIMDVEVAPLITKAEVKEPEKPIDEFLHSLMYARDNFASSPEDKAVLSNIIINLEKKHAAGKKS